MLHGARCFHLCAARSAASYHMQRSAGDGGWGTAINSFFSYWVGELLIRPPRCYCDRLVGARFASGEYQHRSFVCMGSGFEKFGLECPGWIFPNSRKLFLASRARGFCRLDAADRLATARGGVLRPLYAGNACTSGVAVVWPSLFAFRRRSVHLSGPISEGRPGSLPVSGNTRD